MWPERLNAQVKNSKKKTPDRVLRSCGHHRVTLIWNGKYLAHKLRYTSITIQDTGTDQLQNEVMHCSVPAKLIYYNTVSIIFLQFGTGSLRFLTVLVQKHLFPQSISCASSHSDLLSMFLNICICRHLMTGYMGFAVSQILWPSPAVNFFPSFKGFHPLSLSLFWIPLN